MKRALSDVTGLLVRRVSRLGQFRQFLDVTAFSRGFDGAKRRQIRRLEGMVMPTTHNLKLPMLQERFDHENPN